MLRVSVVAHPGARQERVDLRADDGLEVWVRQRAVDNQANVAIAQCVARSLGLRPWQVRLAAGTTSRRKMVELDLPDVAALRARLLAHAVRSG
jgi:uncharacterized protein YggU (UPF0235/DUF167 family)